MRRNYYSKKAATVSARPCPACLAVWVIVAWTTGWCHAAGPEPAAATMLSDASLLDVCFADEQHGWAVGHHGAIWATNDSGRTWHRQVAPVSCTLHSVHFINRQTGWAVGGWIHPYTHRTTGVVLRTRDGGRRWLATPGLTLPKLAKVKFFDDENGWALGDSSTLFPSGVFRTRDAGRSWRTVPSGASKSLVTGDFFDAQTGAMAGRGGELLVVRGANVRDSQTADLGQRTLRSLKLDGLNGWLAGDGGLLMHTSDAGNTWRLAGPPALQAEQFDFHAVAAVENEAWVVGSPGSIVFHSRDQGRTWRAFRTGQSSPLRAIHFVNRQTGWAVGDLGRILTTRDGGQTWHVQRQGGQRVAMLGLFSDPEGIPWEVLARYGGDEGYLTAIQTLGRRDRDQPRLNAAGLEDRLQAGALACGACSSEVSEWFPLRQTGVDLNEKELLALWAQVNDEEPLRALEELMVRRIRQWRPDVVVASQGKSPVERIISRVAAQAVQLAGDPTSHSLQLTSGGLEPWQTKKLFLVRPEGTVRSSSDEVYVLPSQLASRLGASVGEIGSQGRALERRSPKRTQTHAMRLAQCTLPRQVASREVFHGLTIRPGGEARRELIDPVVPLDVLTRRAQLTRNTESFADQTMRNGRADQWAAGLSELTTNLPESGAGALLYELSETFRRQGRLDLAADVLERMVTQHPQHSLSESAMVRLIHYYTSSEDAWRRQASTFMTQQTVASERVQRQAPIRASDIPTTLGRPTSVVGTEKTKIGSAVTAAGHFSPRSRRGRAAELARQMRQNWPELNSDPSVRFALAAVDRLEGSQDDLGRFYQSMMSNSDPSNPWTQRAAAELWLAGGLKGQPAIHVEQAIQGPKPYLDGDLTDRIWKDASHLELRTPHHDDGEWPAAAMIAWDLDYLYIAVRCQKVARASTASTEPAPSSTLRPTRKRDSNMQDRDRVTFRFDVERDYASAFEFTIDDRGWGADRCLGDATWDPSWHIAHKADSQSWTVEAAIPWQVLQAKAPNIGSAWAVDVHRVAPGHGVQSWTRASMAEQPTVNGFGLIVFNR